MIHATELWVQASDGTQRVIRVDDTGVTVRDLREPPADTEPLEPMATTEREAILDLLDELRDDAQAFAMRGNGPLDYATMVVSRLSYIMGVTDDATSPD